MNIQKATWSNGSRRMSLAFPFAKVDKENRTVSGFATLDNVDRHGDVVTADASKRAFERFRGNLREMHQPIAVGKILSFNEEDFFDAESGKNHKGVFVQAYISKGAQDTWEKVLDGTLTGFSIGGNIVEASMEKTETEADEERRVIKEYDLQELSLVDNPANPLANIFSIQKSGDNLIFKGMATEIETENVFWCGSDQIATTYPGEEKACSICGSPMETIGWVEKSDTEKSVSIQKVVNGYLRKDDASGSSHGPNGTLDSPSAPLSVIDSEDTINLYPDQAGNNISTTKATVGTGTFVTWNSSGGKAYGKVTQIKSSGTIKVPDSSFEITASKEEPAALIRVYEKTADGWKPTETMVGHKVKTLSPVKSKNKISKGGSIVTEENLDPQAEEINEVVEEEVTEDAVIEKAAEISEVEVDELDFTKMVTDLKDFVGEKLEKSINDTKEDTNSIRKAFEDEKADLTKRFDTIVSDNQELRKSVDELTNLVTELQKSLADTSEKVAAVESDTAIKKSGEVDKSEVTRKSNNIWQGHFLGVHDL